VRTGSSAFFASQLLYLASQQPDESGDDSDGTKIAAGSSNDGSGAYAGAAAGAAAYGRRRDAGCVHCWDDLRAKLPATPRCVVHVWSSRRGGGSAILARPVEA